MNEGIVSNLGIEVGHERSYVLRSCQPLMQEGAHVQKPCGMENNLILMPALAI